MEEKVYANYEKAEEIRPASHWQAEDILDKDKEKVVEVWQLAYSKMA